MALSAVRTVLTAGSTTMLAATSANSTNPGSIESSTDLLNDRINLIAATTLPGFTYGILTFLYCVTVYFLSKKLLLRTARFGLHPLLLLSSRAERRNTLFYLVYSTLLFVLATLYTASDSQNAVVAYVDNRLYPGGPYQYYVTFMVGQNLMVMSDISSLIILWMTDGLILYRFIMFYYHAACARWIIVLPCAMYVGVVVLSALVLQGEASFGKIFYLSEGMLLAYNALSLSLNVITTVLIATRLYWRKIKLERMFGSSIESPYMNIVTMLIESAALYGTWSLVSLILCVLRHPGQVITLATVPHIQVIAPLLIILWIARGRAWNHGTNLGEDDGEPVQVRLSGIGKLSFGSRSVRAEGEGFRPSTSWSASLSQAGRGAGSKPDLDLPELGPCGSGLSSTIDDIKV